MTDFVTAYMSRLIFPLSTSLMIFELKVDFQ